MGPVQNPVRSGHTGAGSSESSCSGGCPTLQRDAGLVWISRTGPSLTVASELTVHICIDTVHLCRMFICNPHMHTNASMPHSGGRDPLPFPVTLTMPLC